MSWSLSVRRPAALAAVLVVSVMGGASPARAATVGHFDVTQTNTYTAPLEGCLPPDLLGTVTLTEHSTGQVVINGAAVVITGSDVYDFHMDLPDGRYVQQSGPNRDDFEVALRLPYDTARLVDSQDHRTIHAADGTVIGTLTIHEEQQVVYRDLNTNGDPDPGEVTVEHHEFRLTCTP